MNERLKNIKDRYMEYEYNFALNREDINWLIKQAEKVEQYEKAFKKIKEALNSYHEIKVGVEKLEAIIESDIIQAIQDGFEGKDVNKEEILKDVNWLIEKALKVNKYEKMYHSYLDKYTKMVGIKNEIIQLANDFKNGYIGEVSDSFLVDEILEILNR